MEAYGKNKKENIYSRQNCSSGKYLWNILNYEHRFNHGF